MTDQVKESDFWSKIANLPKSAGREVLMRALLLWCILKDGNTPAWAKLVIVGALLYFINPIDGIPDFLPGGFVDDAAAMGLALLEVEAFKTPAIEEEAKELLPDFLA